MTQLPEFLSNTQKSFSIRLNHPS